MIHSFPFYRQRDMMDCGPTCLMMAAAANGKQYSLPFLRDRCLISRDGVSALGIMEAAESIGFRTMAVKVPFETGEKTASLLEAPLPCIAHWNQNHFVVVYKANKNNVWIADPGAGKFKLKRDDFQKSWCSDQGKGVLILLEPTPRFFQSENTALKTPSKFSTIFLYLHPFRFLIIQILIGMLVNSCIQLTFPFLTQSLVDIGIDQNNIGFIYLILAAQLALFTSQMSVQFIQSRILLYIGTRININMVSDFLAKLMRLPISYFDSKMTGDLLQRIGDQTRIEHFLTHGTLPVLFSMANFIIFSAVLLNYSSSIFAIFLVAAMLYIGWISYFLRRRRDIDYQRFQQASENSHTLIELVEGMQEIKLQGSEQKRRQIWTGIQTKLFQTGWKSLNLSQWQDAGAGFINQSKNILISFMAAQAVINHQMSLGMMMAAQYMAGQLDGPLQQFIGFMRSAQDAQLSLERLSEIHNQEDENASLTPGNAIPAYDYDLLSNDDFHFPQRSLTVASSTSRATDIRIENVSFRYNGLTEPVLHDINLNIPAGKVTAIVGVSGSGKTTLAKLLLGFYRPTKGQILIGNLPLHDIAPSTWRKRCGAVLQDGFIFSDTIANNITECDEHPDLNRLQQSVRIANVGRFIAGLPMGYNTAIGARGNGISQGQRQRLLIGRAVYKNPEFLFFDEATNALDANNERAIVQNLQQFYAGADNNGTPRTVLIIAHRLSTVRHADQIVVLENGRQIETGTHDELVAQRGHYFELIRNQLELGA